MKYKGRIALTLFSLVACAGHILIFNDRQGFVNAGDILYLLFVCLLAWMLGYQYDKIKNKAYIDQLTKSYNRSFIGENFSKLTKQAIMKSKKLVVYFIDIDHFKGINDRYGHHIGDEMIRKVSHILLELFAEQGFVIRWGGDEFVVIVYSDEAHADMLQNYMLLRLKSVEHGAASMPLSVSIGEAVYPDEGLSLAEIVQVADERMYLQKNRRKSNKG